MNKNDYFNKIVSLDFDSTRLDYWLKKNFPNSSYVLFCKLTRKGVIRINSSRAKLSDKLKGNDKIKIPQILINENLKNQEHKFPHEYKKKISEWIIFKNKNFILFNKPSGVAVQGGTKIGFNIDTALSAFTSETGEKPKLVHRIDKDTSGLLLIARNLKYARYLTSLFRDKEITKTYLAIIFGKIEHDYAIIDLPIEVEAKKCECKTLYKVVDKKDNFSLIALKPITGRKHQIRRHLYTLKCPILGDKKFDIIYKNNHLIKRFTNNLNLHAYKVSFKDMDNKLFNFEAYPPNFFMENINELELDLNLFKEDFFLKTKSWPIIK